VTQSETRRVARLRRHLADPGDRPCEASTSPAAARQGQAGHRQHERRQNDGGESPVERGADVGEEAQRRVQLTGEP